MFKQAMAILYILSLICIMGFGVLEYFYSKMGTEKERAECRRQLEVRKEESCELQCELWKKSDMNDPPPCRCEKYIPGALKYGED